MYYVYVLKSTIADWTYTGKTTRLKKRFQEHNQKQSKATRPYAPFTLEAYFALRSREKANQLEHYLKTASGKAFLKKRILGNDYQC